MAYNTTSWTTKAATMTSESVSTTKNQYSYFHTNSSESSSWGAGYHHMLTFENYNNTASPHLGNDPDPATSFTTSNTTHFEAESLVTCLWYISENTYIDAIYSLEGADDPTGDVTRMHAMSFDFTSGATSCLTNGTLLAYSPQISNDGNEQPYLSTWTVGSPSVTAGKVIVVTFESDTINSDYGLNVKIKFHNT